MTCEEVRQKLDAYVDNSCSPEDSTSIEEHLRTCSSCATEALNRVQIKRATRATAATRFVPSPEFRRRIEKSVQSKRKPLRLIWWLPALSALAAAIFIAAVTIGLWTRHAAREQAMTELLDLHVATLASANPVDVVSSDRHTVKPWFQGKLPFTFNVPELDDSPYKLIGGKLTYINHNPAAQLLFEIRKHELSVFILQQSPGLRLPEFQTSAFREKGFSIENWNQNSLRYIIIGDAGPSDVHALADLLRSAAAQ